MYASKQALACVLTSESALKVDVARAHSLCAVLAAAPDEVETSMSQCMVVLDGCQSEMETPRVQAAEIFYNIALTALYHGGNALLAHLSSL